MTGVRYPAAPLSSDALNPYRRSMYPPDLKADAANDEKAANHKAAPPFSGDGAAVAACCLRPSDVIWSPDIFFG